MVLVLFENHIFYEKVSSIKIITKLCQNSAKLALCSFMLEVMCKKYTLNVFLFVVNMRIVGTDENLRPLTGKVKICFLLLQGLNVMSVIIQVFPTSFHGLDCSVL